jgi:hypothetical protein
MPGFLLHMGATVMCAHGGQAQPTVSNPRVLVMSQPVVTMDAPYVIAGCPFPPPPTGNGPCVTARWITASRRVTSDGQPLLLADSQAICVPSGGPLISTATQTRVTAM